VAEKSEGHCKCSSEYFTALSRWSVRTTYDWSALASDSSDESKAENESEGLHLQKKSSEINIS